MKKSKLFIKQFFIAFVSLSFLIGLFVTWVNPNRNLDFPWSTKFVSDRNISYRRFKLLSIAPKVTDLIVGSSTSEVFIPADLKKHYDVNAFAGTSGGASLPNRYLMIKQALKTHTELKRIIYVADLFEYKDLKLSTDVYEQPEMNRLLDSSDLEKIPPPSWSEHFDDIFSHITMDRSLQTLVDLSEARLGRYVSVFHKDGSTSASMILKTSDEPIEKLALRSATEMLPIYGQMNHLDPDSIWMFQKIVALVKSSPELELHLIVPPFHEAFFNQFKEHFQKTRIYSDWIETMTAFQKDSSGRIHVYDFSYPAYQNYGVTSEPKYWHDGVHFSSETMRIMANAIYGSH